MEKGIAVITARGGSKRIPKKNIRNFCGKPIIAYSIETALKTGIFEEVMVSTDDKEIAKIAEKYGAKVPFLRSERNSDDFASTEDVLLEVMEEYKKRNREFSYVCCLYPTAPFITENKIIKAMELMEKNTPAVVIPLVKFSYPPQRCFIIDENKEAKFKYPEYITARSQDLEEQYHDAGQFYVYNVEKLITLKGIIEDDMLPIVVPEIETQDIDNEEDWEIAELKYQFMNR